MKKIKSVVLSLLTLTLCLLLGLMVACSCSKQELTINVPSETLLGELGLYELPKYEVVNEEGLIMAGYNVTVESVVDPDGEVVTIAYNRINATKTGIYEITYSAGKGVKKAVLKVDFAKRTAPQLIIDDGEIPLYYISGMTYSLPVYSLTGSPNLDECYIKVYYRSNENNDLTEVTVTNSQFYVHHNTGEYVLVIHAEDHVGNFKDYEFTVQATGPSEIIEGKILYFDEEFGIEQVDTLWKGWDLSRSSEIKFNDEASSLKVVTKLETDYLLLKRLIQNDVSDYTHLIIRIFNANDIATMAGYAWFGDTRLEPGVWTELKIPIADIDSNASHPAVAGMEITKENITNLTLRLFDTEYSNKLPANSVFYLSSMYAVTEDLLNEPTTIVDDKIAYFDEDFGLTQVSLYWPGGHTISLDNTIKYEDEAGSLKVVFNNEQESNYLVLNAPYIKDVSQYSSIVFRIYNATGKNFKVGTTWAADTVISAEEGWTEVKIPIRLFDENSIKKMDDTILLATDISGLPIRIFDCVSQVAGDTFYISSIYGVTELLNEPTTIVDDKIAYFDEDFGLTQVSLYWPGGHTISLDNTIKYGDEAGSLKVVFNSEQETNYLILNAPYIKDVSQYSSIVFRIYNATGKNFKVGTTWAADTVISAEEGWTEVEIPTSLFDENSIKKMDDTILLATDISGLPIRIFDCASQVAGDTFYISSIYGVT